VIESRVWTILRKHGVGQPCALCTLRTGHAPGDAPRCHVCGAELVAFCKCGGKPYACLSECKDFTTDHYECMSCVATTQPT
jgi:hypothetical protein